MFLTLAFHYKSLKWLIPLTVTFGSAPSFLIYWAILRLFTLILPHRVYRKGDDFLYQLYQRQTLFFFENLSGIKLYLYGDYKQIFSKQESAIVLSNHQSTADWLLCNMVAIRQNSLGHIRFIIKNGLKFFPLFGLYWKFHGFIYVKRQGDVGKMNKSLKNMDIPSWLFIFPEGTRYNPENKEIIAMSHKFAAEHDLPQLDHVLIPRIKATYAAIQNLHKKIDAVYDLTIAYKVPNEKRSQEDESDRENDGEPTFQLKCAPSLGEILSLKSCEIHILMTRIPIDELMKSLNVNNETGEIEESSVATWLINLFSKKDKTLHMFYSDSTLSAHDGKYTKISLKETIPSLTFITLSTCALLSTKLGRKVYFSILFYGTILQYAYMMLFN